MIIMIIIMTIIFMMVMTTRNDNDRIMTITYEDHNDRQLYLIANK